jgi:hypothetical protein
MHDEGKGVSRHRLLVIRDDRLHEGVRGGNSVRAHCPACRCTLGLPGGRLASYAAIICFTTS